VTEEHDLGAVARSIMYARSRRILRARRARPAAPREPRRTARPSGL